MKRPGLGRLIASVILLIVVFALIASVFWLILYLDSTTDSAGDEESSFIGLVYGFYLLVVFVYSVIIAILVFICSLVGFILSLTARKHFKKIWIKGINIYVGTSHAIFTSLCILEYIAVFVLFFKVLINIIYFCFIKNLLTKAVLCCIMYL